MISRRIAFLLVTAFTAAAGCDQSFPTATRCRDIPANGCPVVGNGSECKDPTCAAAYACYDGTWSFEHKCQGFDGGRADAAEQGPADAGSYPDVSWLDAPPGAAGGPGCTQLDSPDCPLSQALLCDPQSADPCCGCGSLFVCQNGGWIFWGGCSLEGGVAPAP